MDASVRIAARYFVLGTAWILLSDALLARLFQGRETLWLAGAAKGWLFIAVTTALVFVWVRRAMREQQALHAQALHLRQAFEAAADALPARVGMLVLDHRGALVSANACMRLSFPCVDTAAPTDWVAQADPASRWLARLHAELLALPEVSARTEPVLFRDGHRTCRIAMGPMRGRDGQPLGRFLILFDIQDLVDAEARARHQAVQYRALFESNPEAMCLCEVGSLRLLEVNAELRRQAGLSAGGAGPLTLLDFLAADQPVKDLLRLMSAAPDAAPGEVVAAGTHRHRRADGTSRQVDVEASLIDVDGQRRWLVSLRDVTQSLADRQTLQEQSQRLQSLTRRTMRDELSLVRRVTGVLHDRIASHLMLAGLNLQRIGADAAGAATADADPLALAKGALEEAMTAVREGIQDLHPAVQLGAGLPTALRGEVQRLRAFTGAPVADIEGACTGEPRPGDVDQAVFLVAREALINAVLHARATTIRTRLHCSARHVHLVIEDDGVGMSPELIVRGRPGHLGLIGMSERAAAAGLQLNIDVAQPHGTRVTIHWTSAADGDHLHH